MQNLFLNSPIKVQNTLKDTELACALYIVSTPIGNLGDITLRALQILQKVDLIICEDSRVAQKLLSQYQIIDKKFLVYNDHSDENIRLKILNLLIQNNRLALISDAGTPLISDPGYKLINFLRSHNQKIISIPGASSVTACISVAGLACDQFIFLGFLPSTSLQKEKVFKNYNRNFSWVFFESANRLLATLELMQKNLDNPRICIARELTKLHEEIVTDNLDKVLNFFQSNPQKLKGEVVVMVEKNDKNFSDISPQQLQESIKSAIQDNKSLKDIAQELSEIYNLNKKEIYQLALQIKDHKN
jgi:16S rRNA (cytidine1402-2'-O)-methyltransferase